MTQRPPGHDRPRLELRLSLPRLAVRRVPTGANAPRPDSGIGGTGTPRHSIRCPHALWGAAVARCHEAGLELGPVLRGYLAAVAAGDAVLYPDPLGEPSTEEDSTSP